MASVVQLPLHAVVRVFVGKPLSTINIITHAYLAAAAGGVIDGFSCDPDVANNSGCFTVTLLLISSVVGVQITFKTLLSERI